MLYVGIDPGEHTGLAVWNSEEHYFVDIYTCKLHEAQVRLYDIWRLSNRKDMFVVFEDARQRRWIPDTHNIRREMGRRQGAGSIKRDCQIWEEFLTDFGIPFEARKPQAGGTKWSADFFKKVTGYTGRCSEHARDAALLVFQKR